MHVGVERPRGKDDLTSGSEMSQDVERVWYLNRYRPRVRLTVNSPRPFVL